MVGLRAERAAGGKWARFLGERLASGGQKAGFNKVGRSDH
jgi:hypothetical protein